MAIDKNSRKYLYCITMNRFGMTAKKATSHHRPNDVEEIIILSDVFRYQVKSWNISTANNGVFLICKIQLKQ